MTQPSSSGVPTPERPTRVRLSVVEEDGTTGEPPLVRATSGEVAQFARDVWESAGPLERMQRGVGLVVELVDGCDHAAVTLSTRGRPGPGPSSDAVGREAGQLQLELHQGPCFDAARVSASVSSADLTQEPRWPRWSPTVVGRLGTRAAMSLVLYDGARVYGSLDLYADRPGAWSRSATVLADVLATHLGLALGDAVQLEHRSRAIVSRTVIGQAQGILMERFNITSDSAYAVLLRTSQQNHVKIAVLAADLVRTARLPGSSDDVRTPPVGAPR